VCGKVKLKWYVLSPKKPCPSVLTAAAPFWSRLCLGESWQLLSVSSLGFFEKVESISLGPL